MMIRYRHKLTALADDIVQTVAVDVSHEKIRRWCSSSLIQVHQQGDLSFIATTSAGKGNNTSVKIWRAKRGESRSLHPLLL